MLIKMVGTADFTEVFFAVCGLLLNFAPIFMTDAPMAELVDASVSNTDRATCTGSSPVRGTEK